MTAQTQATRIHQLVSAIAHFRPSFPEEIAGCTPSELSELQSLLSVPLPVPYIEFLQVMGRGTGGLAPFEADYRISTLLWFHKSSSEPRESDSPLPIGVARWGPFYEGEEASDHPVYLEADGQEARLVAYIPWEKGALFPPSVSFLNVADPTLHEAFFVEAVLKFHLAGFPNPRLLEGSSKEPKLIEQTDALLHQLGFTRHPESDCIGYYVRSDATVLLNNDPPQLYLTAAARDSMEQRRLVDTLSKRLSLTAAANESRRP